jgi:hypothetical protein
VVHGAWVDSVDCPRGRPLTRARLPMAAPYPDG